MIGTWWQCLQIEDVVRIDWGPSVSNKRIEDRKVIGLALNKFGQVELTIAGHYPESPDSAGHFSDMTAERLGIPVKYRRRDCWKFSEGDSRVSKVPTYPYRIKPNPILVYK